MGCDILRADIESLVYNGQPMSFLYFAYGSNMLSSRLIARCSSARVVGLAFARSYVLEFSKKSIDGSGKAALVEKTNAIHTPGVLFEIDAIEREALDKFEGAGKGYDRVDDFQLETVDESVTATTYIASETQSGLIPFDWYLALVIAGAREHKLGDAHVVRLRAMKSVPDGNVGRASRITALEALARHGYDDHIALLRN